MRFAVGMFEIAVIQMQIAVVQVNAAQSMVVAILLIDGGSFLKFGQGFLAELLKAAAVLRLALSVAGSAPRRSFPAAGGIGIDFAAQVQGRCSRLT